MSIVLLSGGVDSAYLLLVAGPCRAVVVDYGQPSANMELRAAARVAAKAGVQIQSVTMRGLNLGQMADGDGPCVVPARNALLVSAAFNLAETNEDVWIGAAPQDMEAYPDCRPVVLRSLSSYFIDTLPTTGALMWSGAPRETRVAGCRAAGFSDLVWSCYGAGPEPCGECASCRQ